MFLLPHSPLLWQQTLCCRHNWEKCGVKSAIIIPFSKKIASGKLPVATFKQPIVTCGEWQQGWLTLIYCIRFGQINFACSFDLKLNPVFAYDTSDPQNNAHFKSGEKWPDFFFILSVSFSSLKKCCLVQWFPHFFRVWSTKKF